MDPLTTTYDHLDSNNFSDEAVNGIHVEDMLVNPAGNNSEQEGDEDEVFVYPIESSENAKLVNERPTHDNYSEDNEDFTYPSSETPLESPAQSSSFIVHLIKPNHRSNSHPTSAQLESVFTAGLSGNLELLQNLFDSITSSNDVEPFSLANDASPRTGLNVIHAASSRGHMNIVKWLIQECGGIPDLEDREGEFKTSLHKAAMNGHLPVVSYLIFARANVHAQDGDGWTALHNACSKGYLDIVKWLCENSSAAEDSGDNHGVNVKSKGGWTPLMNAASKGHLPVVLYLLYKRSADPYIRNNWGETAYDIAAAVFEVWICEVLQKAEQEKWRCDPATYNLLAVHTTVPIVLYENQRLGSKMKNFPISSKRLKFTNSGLGRNGHRAAFELRAPISDGRTFWPAWRSEVQLPLLEDPFRMPKPLISTSTRDTIERSHFWLSDWTLDTTCPRVDAIEGWQYSQSFDNGEDDWSAEPNIQMASPVGHPRPIQTATIQSDRNSYGCVRRRRWVRLMRRRLDIDPLPYLQPDGVFYQVSNEGRMAPLTINGDSSIEGRELEDVQGPFLSLNQDYVSRARYLARTFSSAQRDTSPSPVSRRRAISKLQHAISDLETGIEGDGDHERKVQAEVLLNAYERELDREREALGIPDDANLEDLPDRSNGYDSEDSFHYPGSISAETPSARPSSTHSSSDYFSRSSVTRTSADLTSSLIQSPDFRVPTHEAPQKLQVTHRVTPTPQIIHPQWERDETVSHCRACKRHFTILFRKHHCRRCGRIFCDRCSSYRAVLDVVDVVHDGSSEPTRGNPAYRVCESCFDEVNAAVPNRYQSSRNASMERIVVDEERLAIPSNLSREESNSQISDLAECPVCNQNLAQLGSASLQEAHVKTCLEGGSNALNQMAKYLVYKLPEESLLIGVECVICLEEFTKGCMVARLSCLCSFHNTCLSAWLQRGKNCPIHARDS